MRYEKSNLKCDYFGEWSLTKNKAHGRGVWFGGNLIRVGYYTKGKCSDG